MAKKSFKKSGGYSTGMYQSSEVKHTSTTPATRKQKVSAKGFKRHTFMVKPEHLEELQEIARLSKADMQDVLAAALEYYFAAKWPDDKKAELRKELEEEAKKRKRNLL